MPTQPAVPAQPAPPVPAQKVLVDALLAEEIGPPIPKQPIQDKQVTDIMEALRKTLVRDPNDEKQVTLVDTLQQSRALLFQYAIQQYVGNPKSASLLEGIVSLIGHMEKAVRDDRKEKAKEKENENNIVSFNQMVEAMKSISAGKIALPVFDMKAFILDPTKSLLPTNAVIPPIKPEELAQGNQIVDIEGNPVA